MLLMPSIDHRLVLGLAVYNICAANLMEIGRRRMWVLSGLVTPILAITGCATAAEWLLNDVSHFNYNAVAELMKAYFLVDLAYCATFHWSDTALLDCWAHHIFYFFYLDWLQQTGQAGLLQPFLIMEVPTTIRTMGALVPMWKAVTRPAFFWSFVAFRVVWPAWVLTEIWMTTPNFIVAMAALALHCYWLGAMMRVRPPLQPPTVPLLVWRW
jgi:hypothetical protein